MIKIDFSYLEILSDDDEDFKTEFIETFKDTYISLIAKMKDELASSDFNNLSKSAHQLKPSAKMIQLSCAETLADLQHNPANASPELIDQITEECEEALKQLQDWAASH